MFLIGLIGGKLKCKIRFSVVIRMLLNLWVSLSHRNFARTSHATLTKNPHKIIWKLEAVFEENFPFENLDEGPIKT